MKNIDAVRGFLEEDAGATMVEYAFLIAFIAIIVAVGAELFGVAVKDAFGLPLPWL